MKRHHIVGAEVLRDASRDRSERLDIWIEAGPGRRADQAWSCTALPRRRGDDRRERPARHTGPRQHATRIRSRALLQGAVPGEPLDLFVIRAIARRAARAPSARSTSVRFSMPCRCSSAASRRISITSGTDCCRRCGAWKRVLRAHRDIGIRAAVGADVRGPYLYRLPPIDQQASRRMCAGACVRRSARRPRNISS
jgi:hypothetical protein